MNPWGSQNNKTMENRTLQIDVKGEEPQNKDLICCNIYVDGRSYRFWTTKSEYELMLDDKVFIRNGKHLDSANVLNTTNVFVEDI